MKRKGITSKQVSRRDFLKAGAAAGAVLAAGAITAPYYVPSTAFGSHAPSERIGIGFIVYSALKLASGKARECPPAVSVIALLFAVRFVLL